MYDDAGSSEIQIPTNLNIYISKIGVFITSPEKGGIFSLERIKQSKQTLLTFAYTWSTCRVQIARISCSRMSLLYLERVVEASYLKYANYFNSLIFFYREILFDIINSWNIETPPPLRTNSTSSTIIAVYVKVAATDPSPPPCNLQQMIDYNS